MSEIAISLKNVSKCYKRYAHPVDRLKEILLPGKIRADEFWALRDINLEVPKGQTIGIVGRNGSGKSTLLQIIAGTLTPTTGEVKVKGRVSALLELGSGFNPEFTGRQNVFFNGRLLGLEQKEIEAKFDDITAFADIGDFIDQPVKTYSSGMFIRLAFAVAISVEPDILMVDEALAVGDEAFQRKCFARIHSVQERGGTVLFVSHAATSVIELCSSAVLIDQGDLILSGNPKLVVSSYHKLIYAPTDKVETLRQELLSMDHQDLENKSLNYSKDAETKLSLPLRKQALYDPHMVPKSTISYVLCGVEIKQPYITTLEGKKVNLLVRRKDYIYTYSIKFDQTSYKVRFAMLIKTVSGLEIGGAMSHTTQNAIECVEQGSILQVQFRFRCFLQPGVYFFNAGVHGLKDEAEVYLHRIIDAAMFRVQAENDVLETLIIDFQTEAFVSKVNSKSITPSNNQHSKLVV
ncbi:MAG: ABC transporter ATP-binding protein [Kastovskya adunca ATA6-11-RM4]|jgi:lipopolysaccharide transport system ATP-binding protein|nr:ABC transporter ATP-binding protein [Kastovskya adunca ATA6-11-RM4]